MYLYDFFDYLAELFKDLLFVVAMTTAVNQAGNRPNVAVISVGPLHHFDVSIAFVHVL